MSKLLITLLLFLLCIENAMAIKPNYDVSAQRWMSREYDKFIINYPQLADKSVETYAQWYQHFFSKYQSFFGWTPKEKFQVNLLSQFDLFNGFSTPIPFNQNGLFLTTYDELGSLTDRQSQIRGLVNHELVHLFHMDKNSGYSREIRNLFGRHFLTFPAVFQPSLLIEGLAVYFETDKAKGFGRGANSWFPAQMRMEVLKGLPKKINPLLNFSHSVRNSSYLYGYYFYDFLFETYGEKAIKHWIEEFSDNLIPFRVDSNASHLSGHDLEYEWSKFIDWLHHKFSVQINQLKQIKTPMTVLDKTHSETYNQPFFLNSSTVVYFQDDGEHAPTLMTYNLRTQEREVWFRFDDQWSAFSVRYDFHPQYGLLFTKLGHCLDDGLRFDLYHLDIVSKEERRVTHCQSIRRAVWDDQGGVIAVQSNRSSLHSHTSSNLSLVESNKLIYLTLNNEHVPPVDLMVVPFDSVVESLDVAGDMLVLSLKKAPEGFNLYQVMLKYSDDDFIPKVNSFKPLIENFNQNVRVRFDAQHRLYYLSDRGNVYNLYRYRFDTQQSEQLNNVVGGVVDYGFDHNQVVISQFSTLGFNHGIFSIPIKPIKVETNDDSTDKQLDIGHSEELAKSQIQMLTEKPYSSWDTLKPTSWVPLFSFKKNKENIFGLQIFGQDAIGLHGYQLDAGLYQRRDYVNVFMNMQYLYDQRWFLSINQTPKLEESEENQVRLKQSGTLDYIYSMTTHLKHHFGVNHQRIDYAKSVRSSIQELPQNSHQTYLGTNFQYRNTRTWRKQMQPHQGMTLALGGDSSIEQDSHRSASQVIAFNMRYFYPVKTHSIFGILDIAKDLQPINSMRVSEDFTIPILIGNRAYQFKGVENIETLESNQIQKAHLGWQSPAKIIDDGFYFFPLGLGKLSLQIKAGMANLQAVNIKKKQTLYNYELNMLADVYVGYFAHLPVIISYAEGWTKRGKNNKQQRANSFSFSLNLPY